MKKIIGMVLCLCLLLCACGKQAPDAAPESAAAQPGGNEAKIVLKGDTAEVRGGGAKAEGSTVTIGAVGEYRVSGTLDNGQIVVDTGEDKVDVTLILDGAQITNLSGPAIWVRQAKNVHVYLAAGSENLLVSGSEADLAGVDDTRSGAALFSEDDLMLEGEGRLTVRGYLNNGITCKDDLKIKGGQIEVLGANNGIRASESIEILGGETAVYAGNDGLKTSSADKEGKGYIEISGGLVSVKSAGDAIDAVTELRVSGGEISTETRQDLLGESSRKGLKADQLVDISGGTLNIRADEDGLRSGGDVRMSGGEVLIVASTGAQSGVTGSGTGDIQLSGGKLTISAAKQALKAEGGIYANNELLALCGSDKQAQPREGGQAWLLDAVDGSMGDEVRVGNGSESFSAPQSFRVLLYSSSGLERGESCPVQVGQRSYTLTAR